jgi:hypothetical protein
MFDMLISLLMILYAVKKILNVQMMTIVDFVVISYGGTYGLVPLINSRLGGGLQFSDTVTIEYGIGIFLFISGMYFISYIAPFKTVKELTNIVPIDVKMTFVIFLIVSVIRLVMALVYGSFASFSDDSDALNGYFQLFLCLEITLACALWILLAKCIFDDRGFLSKFLFMLEIFYIFAWGRRVFFVFVCILAFFFRFSKRWHERGLFEYLSIAFFSLIFVFLIMVFQPLRVKLGELRDQGGGLNFAAASEQILESDPGNIIEKDSINIKERDPIYAFHKRIIESQETQSPLFGGAMLAAFIQLTPSFLFFKNVEKVYSKMTIQRYYGMSEIDTAGSWPAVGQADFGLCGTFLYGCLFAIILKIFEAISWRFKNSVIGVASLGALFFVAGSVEQGPEEVFGLLRDLAIFSIFVMITRFIARTPSGYD